MSQQCPNCKLNCDDPNLVACPYCHWDFNFETTETLIPSSSTSTPSLAETTLEPPKQLEPSIDPDATARANEAPLHFDASPSAQLESRSRADKTHPSIDEVTLESASHRDPPTDQRNSGPTVFDPTTFTPSTDGGSIRLPGTTQRSITTVIPPRSIGRDSEPGKLQDYQLGKRIGSGSFGVVFQAKQLPLDRNVALKVLTSSDTATREQLDKIQIEFLREAQFTGKLEHPNIVPIHDIGLTTDERSGVDYPFYVMKEIHGVSWLQKIGKFSRLENLDIFKRVVDAIGFAHNKHVLHCDLKPENVMLGSYGEVLVVDWGQAIDLSRPESIRPGGTPAYISPEMANYWCDIYLDKKKDSPAKAQIGPRCDVYLLGAILFEIVTGEIPRNANHDEGESQYDVMRRACKNDVRDITGFKDDELMQIARRTLRQGSEPAIESIEELQAALKQFETRSLSIQLRQHADQLLAAAKAQNSYDNFQKAKLSYEESLDKWSENRAAKTGLRNAKLSCAELALVDQNFDLGLNMLSQPETDAEHSLYRNLLTGKAKRDRRKKLVQWLAIGLAASILIGIGINSTMIMRNLDLIKKRDVALQEKEQIETQIGPLKAELVDNEQKVAASQQEVKRVESEFALAEEQAEFALANQQLKFAEERKTLDANFETEKRQAEERLAEQRTIGQQEIESEKKNTAVVKQELNNEIRSLDQRIIDLKESSQILQTKEAVTNVWLKLQSGGFREARELLDATDDKHSWEWARLNLLAHREIESYYPAEPVLAATASNDGKRLALLFADRVEILDTENWLAKPLVIFLEDATAIALSSDGRWLAAGRPAGNDRPNGTLSIFDISQSEKAALYKQLDGPSRAIERLEFSCDDRRLLAVGQPSTKRKSAGGIEEEIMVWENWGRLKVSLTNDRGEIPKFSEATFSSNGRTILTCNSNGLARDQFLNLLTESNHEFRWAARSPLASLNSAAFANDDASEIVACRYDDQTKGFRLVTWSPAIARQSQNRLNPDFVSMASDSPPNTMVTVAELENKLLHFDRHGDWLLAGGEDRTVTRWNWNTKLASSYLGHSRKIAFCKLIPGTSPETQTIVSVATGSAAEILKTDLQTYRPETVSEGMASSAAEGKPSPTSFFRSQITGRTAYANDQGQAAITIPIESNAFELGLTRPTTAANRSQATLQWEVSAWKEHYLTDEFLLAQSRGDLFYQYEQKTGRLVRVLTKLRENGRDPADRRGKIKSFDVSADAKRAVVVTDSKSNVIEIWDLENEKLLRNIEYRAAQIFGQDTDKELLQVRISPDGKSVVAAKVGLFAWSTETGQSIALDQKAIERPRTSISAINFITQTSQLVASWKGRIDLVDLAGQQPTLRFNLPHLGDDKKEPNVLDCIRVDDQLIVLAKTVGHKDSPAGIILYDLSNDLELAAFPNTAQARFSRRTPGDVLFLKQNKKQTTLMRFQTESKMQTPVTLEVSSKLESRFNVFSDAHELANGNIVLQAERENPLNVTRKDWNSISINLEGQTGSLRVLAKPRVEYCAVAGALAITLDSEKLQFWNLGEKGIRPDGLFPDDCRIAVLSPNERWLAVASANQPEIAIIDVVSKNTVAQLANDDHSIVSAMTWATNSDRLILGKQNGVVEFWEWNGSQGVQANRIRSSTNLPSISEINVSLDGNALLTFFSDSNTCRVSHFRDGNWNSFLIRSDDGQSLVTGDISDTGNRVISGSDRGRLTLWNSTPVKTAEQSDDSPLPEFGSVRELFDLESRHRSRIQFAEFFEAADGSTGIVSAAENSGENQVLFWPTVK